MYILKSKFLLNYTNLHLCSSHTCHYLWFLRSFLLLIFIQPSPIQLCFYPSTTHLPVQITGRQVVVRADKYCQDVLDHEHLGHVKGHKLWVCDDTRWPCGILRFPVSRRVQFLKHDLIQICEMCFIHHVISRMVTHGIATKYLGI